MRSRIRALPLLASAPLLLAPGAAPAWACEGCRVMQSPSFNLAICSATIWFLSIMGAGSVAWLRRLRGKPSPVADAPSAARAKTRLTALNFIWFLCFVACFLFEVFCWHGIHRQWFDDAGETRLYRANRFLMWTGFLLPLAAYLLLPSPPMRRLYRRFETLSATSLPDFLWMAYPVMYGVSANTVGPYAPYCAAAVSLAGFGVIYRWFRPGTPRAGNPIATEPAPLPDKPA